VQEEERPRLGVARSLVDAVNLGDSEAFAASFDPDGVVVAGGRRFAGREEISDWSDRELIDAIVRADVAAERETPEGAVLELRISSGAHAGGRTWTLEIEGVLVRSLLVE
jgi:hypothetical protein